MARGELVADAGVSVEFYTDSGYYRISALDDSGVRRNLWLSPAQWLAVKWLAIHSSPRAN